MKHRPPTFWLLALFLVPLVAFGLRFWGLDAAGETWDEVAYFDAAHDYWENVNEGRWQDSAAWLPNREHPAIAKWLYMAPSLSAFEAGVSDLHPGRLLSAFLGTLTVLLTMLIGRRLYDERVGVLAGVIFALLPTSIAFSRVLGLDTPTTFFFTLTIWLFIEALEAKRLGWVWHLVAAVAFGLALGTRFSSALLWPLLGALALIYYWPAWRQGKQFGQLAWSALYLVVPPLIVYATWPWLWSDFAAHWDQTIGHWNPVSGFFLGVIQFPGIVYYLLYYLVSFPALVVLASVFFASRTLVRGSRSDWVVLIWFLAVFAFALYGLRQGGIRYLLALTPALALGVAAWITELASRMKRYPQAAWALPAILVAYLGVHAVLHQPYQLDYYNEFSGGTAEVAKKKLFQVGWWGEGVDEAVEWLNAHAPFDATLSFTAIPDRAQQRLRKDFDHTAGLPDYILTNPAYAWYMTEYPGLGRYYQRVYSVDVQGASIASVWERVE